MFLQGGLHYMDRDNNIITIDHLSIFMYNDKYIPNKIKKMEESVLIAVLAIIKKEPEENHNHQGNA